MKSKNRGTNWNCLCECGNLTIVRTDSLSNGSVRSCGCLRDDKSKSRKGTKHHNWKESISDEERIKQRNSLEYEEWREGVYKRDNYTCRICYDNSGGNLNAHHLDGYSWCKEKRTDISNGITLCIDCHEEYHQIYGYNGNTKEDFFEYCKDRINEFKYC